MHRVVDYSKNLSIKYHKQKFCFKISFSVQYWTGLSIETCKKFSVFRMLNKNINFRIESVEKPTIFDLLFLIVIHSPKNDNKHPFEVRNYHYTSPFTITKVFPVFRPILRTALIYWLTIKFLQIFLCSLSCKNKSQSIID